MDDDERAPIERHLATCAACHDEVDRHREVASLHAVGAEPITEEVPDSLWSRIETGIGADEGGTALVITTERAGGVPLSSQAAVAAWFPEA